MKLMNKNCIYILLFGCTVSQTFAMNRDRIAPKNNNSTNIEELFTTICTLQQQPNVKAFNSLKKNASLTSFMANANSPAATDQQKVTVKTMNSILEFVQMLLTDDYEEKKLEKLQQAIFCPLMTVAMTIAQHEITQKDLAIIEMQKQLQNTTEDSYEKKNNKPTATAKRKRTISRNQTITLPNPKDYTADSEETGMPGACLIDAVRRDGKIISVNPRLQRHVERIVTQNPAYITQQDPFNPYL